VSPTALLRLGRIYGAVLLALVLVLLLVPSVDRDPDEPLTSVVSVWRGGERKWRKVSDRPERALEKESRTRNATRVVEDVLDESPVITSIPALFGLSFVAGADGVKVTYDDRTAYATPSDLLKLRAYDAFVETPGLGFLRYGVNPELVQTHLAEELGVSREELVEHGSFRRVAMRRRWPPEQNPEVHAGTLRSAAIAAGQYLARAVREDGSYHYEIDAATGEESPDYNWPRHSGATWYLADVAIYMDDAGMKSAAKRAAERLTGYALVDCGPHRCIAEGNRADLGSSALGLLALVEIVEGKVAPELEGAVRQLADFLLSQQRPDGEFKHFYNREARQAVDRQVLYYTGEAAFALGRAARLLNEPKYLTAASRALRVLVARPAWYIGWRYFWGAEHWTCHAMNEIWDRAPDPEALRFCLDWQESIRDTAVYDRESNPDYDGATSGGPMVPPGLGGSASRMEAAVSTLKAARAAGIAKDEVERLEAGIRDTLRFLMRYQFVPGPHHIMPDPDRMHGGFPQSTTNLKVRIDQPQHAGTALLHYLEYLEKPR
jgi:hypothetical protein